MTRKKILGLLIGASLLIGYEPVAEAMPVATPSNAVEMSGSIGAVVQQARVVRRVARRTTRRTTRRAVRRHYWRDRTLKHRFDISAESATRCAFSRNFGCGMFLAPAVQISRKTHSASFRENAFLKRQVS
jgi:hypothetical protein